MLFIRKHLRPQVVGLALVIAISGAGLPAGSGGLVVLAADPSPSASTRFVPSLSLPQDDQLAAATTLGIADEPTALDGPLDPDTVIDDALATADGLPGAEWDLEALTASLGGDPEAAFRLLRDSIRFEPYPGELRGAQGTLAARAGNSFDRATLLKAILDGMGLTTRFALGYLDQPTAAALVAHTFDLPTKRLQAGAGSSATTLDLEAVASRARRDYALLRGALDASDAPIGEPSADDPVTDVERHAWVQVMTDGAWVDYDPSLPDAQVGQSLTAATGTSEAIPDDQRQAVTLRVVAETLVDDGLAPTVVLERRLIASEAGASDIFLYFQPDSGGGGLLGGVGAAGSYLPELMVDGVVQQGDAFPTGDGDDSGGFGFGGGGGPAFAGLWLALVREIPGRDPLETDVPLVDRVPAEARASGTVTADLLAPLPATDAGPIAMGAIRHVMVSTGGASPLQAATDRAAAAGFIGTELVKPGAEQRFALGDLLWPVAVADDVLTLASERVMVPAVSEPGSVEAVIARPRIQVLSMGSDPHDPSRLLSDIDLAVDGVRLVARDGSDPADLAHRQEWYGVLESALETEMLRQTAGAFDPTGRTLTGVSMSMDQPLTILAPEDPLPVPPGVAAGIGNALAAGQLVVVPGDPATTDVWWTVSPVNGATRAVLAPTRGGTEVSWGHDPATDIQYVQGGWTPGGGSYVNSSNGGVTWHMDNAGNSTGFEKNGKFYPNKKTPPKARNDCEGGNEYISIIGCVSVPTAIVIGTVSAVIALICMARIIRAVRS